MSLYIVIFTCALQTTMVVLGGVENSQPMEDDGSGAYIDIESLGQVIREALITINTPGQRAS